MRDAALQVRTSLFMSDAFSAITIVGALVLPEVIVGIDRGVDHAKTFAAAHPQSLVDQGEDLLAHLAGADRVQEGRADLPAATASSRSLCSASPCAKSQPNLTCHPGAT
jgi:hypothetical protein